MDIKEIVFFPTQLIHVETTSIKAEKLTDKIEKKFDITAKVHGEVLNKNTGKSIIVIKISNEGYYIEEQKEGIFRFEEEIIDEKLAVQFMEVQGVRILWSYLREDIYSVSAKMLSQPIMIPTIDVMKTLEKAQ